MTVNGIDVDETPADESRDLIIEAGRIARGELDGYQGVSAPAYIRALVDEVGGALIMARDTYRDLQALNRVCGRVEQERACQIAADHADTIIARLEGK